MSKRSYSQTIHPSIQRRSRIRSPWQSAQSPNALLNILRYNINSLPPLPVIDFLWNIAEMIYYRYCKRFRNPDM